MPSIVKQDEKENVEVDVDQDDQQPEVANVDDVVDAETGFITPEDLPEDTVLFEGGPTMGQIVEWKKEYGGVYVTEISFDKYVVWRNINRREYKHLVRTINDMMESGKYSEVEINMYNEEATCDIGILAPKYSAEEFETELAGLPSIISQQILQESGFTPKDTRQL